MADTFRTITEPGESNYTEKRSRFLGFALHAETEDEVKEMIAAYRKKFYDARHVCWAYVLGNGGERERGNDDGEPSGSAGKPMLGQIHSAGVTNVLVIVVRYFGGVKLGTGGLFAAYKIAAQEALQNAATEERLIMSTFKVVAPYADADTAMRYIREGDGNITARDYTATDCIMTVEVRLSKEEALKERISKILSARIEEP